jgi:putative alpha-1,2-mannosidase
LIEACGGAETFRRRLDLFFERKRYNVGNEPSFLTPCLYHWIGRPDLTSDRVRQIISDNYTDLPDGLPGNDDSGAMSSWLAFHMLGLYPNAGQSYYLLHAPLVPEWTLQLSNGQTLHGILKGKGTHF